MSKSPDIKNASIKDRLEEKIKIDSYIDEGTDGVVYKGNYINVNLYNLAIKFYFAREKTLFNVGSFLPSFEDLKHRFDNELKVLEELNHPNIQKYYSYGDFEYTHDYFKRFKPIIKPRKGTNIPFIVSKHIDGINLQEMLDDEDKKNDNFNILSYLIGISKALEYLHSNDILHGDVRSKNIIIEKHTNNSILIDYGVSKNFRYYSTDKFTKSFIDPNPIPSEIKNILKKNQTKENLYNIKTIENILFPSYDLYCYGLMLEKLLKSNLLKDLTIFNKKYLEMVVLELKKWKGEEKNGKFNTSHTGFIKSASDLEKYLNKLSIGPDYFRTQFIKTEKTPHRRFQRRNGILELRESLVKLAAHPIVGRLNNLKQLSMLYYLFPGAGQSRYDHSLSALTMVQQIWKSLSSDYKFLFLMDIDDISRLEIIAFLHDINHYPFLHYFQEVGIKEVDNANILNTLLNIKIKYSEKLSDLLNEYKINIEYLRKILIKENYIDLNPQDQIIKSIVNSGVDIDKLSYLQDDAFYTNTPYGLGVDIFKLLDKLEVDLIKDEYQKEYWHIIFNIESLPAIESVCFARFWNFKRIYWHKTNRAIASMIIWTIQKLYTHEHHDFNTYLVDTKNFGESGALEYICDKYKTTFEDDPYPPIYNLNINRNVIYRSIFEMPLNEKTDLLLTFQNKETGYKKRKELHSKLLTTIESFLKENQCEHSFMEYELILDIPMRNMDLGGNIYIRNFSSNIENALERSSHLKLLEKDFNSMSKTLRLFVPKRIRNLIFKTNKINNLESSIRDLILNSKQYSENK